jgi:hypothetical protein
MEFHVTPVQGESAAGSPEVMVISPISGYLQYAYRRDTGRWLSAVGDEHDLEGMIVRDMLRVFGGVLNLD